MARDARNNHAAQSTVSVRENDFRRVRAVEKQHRLNSDATVAGAPLSDVISLVVPTQRYRAAARGLPRRRLHLRGAGLLRSGRRVGDVISVTRAKVLALRSYLLCVRGEFAER